MTALPSHHAKRVYLSGGMEYAPNEGRDWRSTLQEWLEREARCEVFNPNAESEKLLARVLPGIDFRQLKLDDPERFREVVQEIVDLDSREIAERSDYVICYWDRAAALGAGTKGEITMARYFGKPVYLVTSFALQEIPGWALGCTSRVFPDFETLRDFLRR
jgi:hypothetical protein